MLGADLPPVTVLSLIQRRDDARAKAKSDLNPKGRALPACLQAN